MHSFLPLQLSVRQGMALNSTNLIATPGAYVSKWKWIIVFIPLLVYPTYAQILQGSW